MHAADDSGAIPLTPLNNAIFDTFVEVQVLTENTAKKYNGNLMHRSISCNPPVPEIVLPRP
jgi:hypothetical protein